ncbi:aldo/keto reductase family oxidoreductase [Pokkaliibacter sp. CJK22405]|uniref:aldo/keto reductase n=1 Tax=Pokkaliibacter sp. CJK22405 TaxID=3384615 RepID=UPI003985073A
MTTVPATSSPSALPAASADTCQSELVTLSPWGGVLAPIVVGMWRLDEWPERRQALADWMNACIELGLTSFDVADIYGGYQCERWVGEALATGSVKRENIQIVTKCDICLPCEGRPEWSTHHYNTDPDYLTHAVERSLSSLGTDYIDLLLLHRPDPLMNADEVAEALQALQNSGKVRAFGVSNFTPSQFALLQSRWPQLVTNQIEMSLLQRQSLWDGTLDQMQQLRVRPMAWSPLGGGQLFDEAANPELYRVMQAIASQHNTSVAVIALAWLLRHPAGVLPVLGTGKLERIREMHSALNLKLSREEWFGLLTAAQGHPIP